MRARARRPMHRLAKEMESPVMERRSRILARPQQK
jgi:hypothetical protein